ncbi:MAG: Asp/Glu racemase [Caulobacterales bacterium]|nr:Asp/Glu racemase [Caulobacterales bacterium]
METEIPWLLRARESVRDERFTFHSSRMRMQKVTKEQLEAMDRESLRCAAELADARVDVMGYACLVAIMSMGHGYHRASETKLSEMARDEKGPAPIVTSAGALIEGLHALGAKKVSIVTPYMRPLTDLVVGYVESEGVEVVDSIALEIPDNLEVGRRDPMLLLDDIERLDVGGADAVVLSACVQMPSLAALERAQDKLGLPVTSAAACSTWRMLTALGLEPVAPGGAAILGDRRA